jgi:regulator of protease activity HflC (stomatin/prohibitin superfamily)
MAQDPEPDEVETDASSDMDMVTLFSSSAMDAELEANNIHFVLEAAGIPSALIEPSVIPSLEYQVQVPRADAAEAERVLAEARAAGPEAAAEAEAASEEGR